MIISKFYIGDPMKKKTKEGMTNVQKSSETYQFVAAAIVNILTICYGMTAGWTSPSLMILKSDKTPLPSGKINLDEASWIAALVCVGGLLGNIFFGFITSKFGRKIPILSCSFLTIIAWSLILFAQNVYYLYVSRLLNGFVGGGVYSLIPLYLSEIASDGIRGILGSTMVLFYNFGMILAYIFGSYFDFYLMPKIVIVMAMLFGIALSFFPETASFLVKQNKIAAAEKSICFYRNLKKDTSSEAVQLEINQLKCMIDADNTKKLDNSSDSDLTTGMCRKALIIGIVLSLLNQLSGCFAMMQYTAQIFEDSGSSMSPNESSIIVGVIQLFGSIMALILVDRAGRKILFIVSTIGIALGLITLGLYMQYKSLGYDVSAFNWIPVASFSFVIFIASFAVLTLPFLVISEVLPNRIKDFGTSLCIGILWVCAFAIVKFFLMLQDILQFHGTMFLFAGYCIAGAIFIIFYMPETKGKSYEEIMNSLR